MAPEASSPMIYAGTFRHRMDSKNRITIPADWRTGETTKFYVRINSSGACIQVMPPSDFQRLKESFETLPSMTPGDRLRAVRNFAAESLVCNADRQGRMVLPDDYCKRIGCKDDGKENLVLVGSFDRFEIWSAEQWETTQRAEQSAYRNAASLLGL